MTPENETALAVGPKSASHRQPCVRSPLSRRADAVFSMLLLLALGTIPWRASVLTWRPIWRVEIPSFPDVTVGVLSLLPLPLFAAWTITRVRARASSPWQWGAGVIALPLAGMTLLGLLGLRDPSAFSLLQAGGLGVMWLVYLFQVNQRTRLSPILACIVLLQGAIALGQLVRQAGLGLAVLGEVPLSLAGNGISVLDARGSVWIRAYGLTPSPNVLGACLAVLLLLLWQPVVSMRPLRGAGLPETMRYVGLMLAVTIGVLGLLASFSRAAWIAFALGVALSVAQSRSGGREAPIERQAGEGGGQPDDSSRRAAAVPAWWIPVLAMLLFVLAYGDLAMSRLVHLDAPTEARSLGDRMRDDLLAWRIIQAHPLRGVGTGNYLAAARVLDPDAAVVHNVPLLVTAEWGLPGAALWLYLALAGLRRPGGTRATWLALLVVGLFDLSLWPTTSWHGAILFGLLAAAIAAGSSHQPDPASLSAGDASREDANAYRI